MTDEEAAAVRKKAREDYKRIIRETDILQLGACPKYKDHPSLKDFGVGIACGILMMLALFAMLGMHR